MEKGTKTAHTKESWELHIGNDYAVVMLSGECTETASIRLRPDVAKRIGPLIAASPDLLNTAIELRNALAAAMRIIAQHELAEEFIEHARYSGIPDGVGVRSAEVIRAATGTEV